MNAHVALAELCRLALLHDALDAPLGDIVEIDEAQRHAAVGAAEHLGVDGQRRRAVLEVDLQVHLVAEIERLIVGDQDSIGREVDGAGFAALANLDGRIVRYTRRIYRTHGHLLRKLRSHRHDAQPREFRCRRLPEIGDLVRFPQVDRSLNYNLLAKSLRCNFAVVVSSSGSLAMPIVMTSLNACCTGMSSSRTSFFSTRR